MSTKPSTFGIAWTDSVAQGRSVRRVKDIAKIVNGFPFESSKFSVEGNHQLIRIRDLNSTKTETKYAGDWIDAAAVQSGDVLIGMDGDFNVGTWQGGPALLNQRMCCVKGHTAIMSRYLAHALPRALQVTNDLTYYTTVKHLSSLDIERITVPVPLEAKLEQVVNYLDDKTRQIDALTAAKEQLAETVREYEQAEISRLLTQGLGALELAPTGRPFIEAVPTHWRVTAFKRTLLGLGQGWSPQCDSRPAEANEWGVLKVGCVNGTSFDANENKVLPPTLEPDLACVLRKGDVLVSRANTRELVGMAALVEEEHPNLLICDKLYRLRLRPQWITAEFTVLLLRSDASRRQIELGASGASSSMQNISQDVIRELLVAVPPLNEQVEIVTKARRIRESCNLLVSHCEEHIARLREYRSSLISSAVTGQLDVGSA